MSQNADDGGMAVKSLPCGLMLTLLMFARAAAGPRYSSRIVDTQSGEQRFMCYLTKTESIKYMKVILFKNLGCRSVLGKHSPPRVPHKKCSYKKIVIIFRIIFKFTNFQLK